MEKKQNPTEEEWGAFDHTMMVLSASFWFLLWLKSIYFIYYCLLFLQPRPPFIISRCFPFQYPDCYLTLFSPAGFSLNPFQPPGLTAMSYKAGHPLSRFSMRLTCSWPIEFIKWCGWGQMCSPKYSLQEQIPVSDDTVSIFVCLVPWWRNWGLKLSTTDSHALFCIPLLLLLPF